MKSFGLKALLSFFAIAMPVMGVHHESSAESNDAIERRLINWGPLFIYGYCLFCKPDDEDAWYGQRRLSTSNKKYLRN